MSSGQYFLLDSDDFLHPRALEDLYNYGIKHKSDLIIGNTALKVVEAYLKLYLKMEMLRKLILLKIVCSMLYLY